MALTTLVLPAPEGPNSAVTPARSQLERHVEREGAEAVAQRDLDAHRRMRARRCGEFGERHEDQRQHDGDQRQPRRFRLAARRLQRGVDRQRQGARLAGNVGDEGDDRAELAEARGERGDHAGDDAGKRERQRQVDQPVEPARAQRLGGLVQALIGAFQREADRPHLEGEGDDRRGQRRAGPAEHEADAEGLRTATRPARPRVPKVSQQQEADRHRRQDQRQMDDAVDQRLAGKARPGQQQRRRDGKRQRGEHRHGGDPAG